MAGKKQIQISDQEFKKSHEAESKVAWVQSAIDPKYGAILFEVLDHTSFYFELSKVHLEEADKYLLQIRSIPVGYLNCRAIDEKTIFHFFHHSQLVVIFSYLALEYFALECSQQLDKNNSWDGKRLDQKLKELIPNALGISKLPIDLCNAFGEIENRRHSLNHPTFNNIVNASETQWDTVHISWMIIGKYKKSYEDALKIHEYLSEPYKNYLAKNTPPTLKFDILKRGIKFGNQSRKKP
ncbi:MAG: hypothetical protein AB1728_01720 [Bacteroidota bacterium]